MKILCGRGCHSERVGWHTNDVSSARRPAWRPPAGLRQHASTGAPRAQQLHTWRVICGGSSVCHPARCPRATTRAHRTWPGCSTMQHERPWHGLKAAPCAVAGVEAAEAVPSSAESCPDPKPQTRSPASKAAGVASCCTNKTALSSGDALPWHRAAHHARRLATPHIRNGQLSRSESDGRRLPCGHVPTEPYLSQLSDESRLSQLSDMLVCGGAELWGGGGEDESEEDGERGAGGSVGELHRRHAGHAPAEQQQRACRLRGKGHKGEAGQCRRVGWLRVAHLRWRVAAALAAKSAATGSFAAAAGGERCNTMDGASPRVFEYLINDIRVSCDLSYYY